MRFAATRNQLRTMNGDGSGRRRLWSHEGIGSAVWAPGGRRIAFTRYARGSNDVWSMRSDGRAKRRLAGSSAHESVFDWSRVPSRA